MHEYTRSGNWKLKVEIEYNVTTDGNPAPRAGTWGVGEWENFAVASEADLYRLTIGSRTENDNMNSVDPFNNHPLNGMHFSTDEDGRDNDNVDSYNCAASNGVGWWYNSCINVCLNCKKWIWSDGTNWEIPSRSHMWMKKTG